MGGSGGFIVIKPKVDPKIEHELREEAREKQRLEEASKDLRYKHEKININK